MYRECVQILRTKTIWLRFCCVFVALSGVSHDDLVENGGSQAWDFREATASHV